MSKKFQSVRELLTANQSAPETVQEFDNLLKGTVVVRTLIAKRNKAGLTQKQVAEAMGVSQSAISKFEKSNDSDLTLGEIIRYSEAVEAPISIQIGPPMTLVQSVKSHAFAMKDDLEKLATLACDNEEDSEFGRKVAGFFGEAGFKIFGILLDAFEKLPPSALKAKTPGLRLLRKETCPDAPIAEKPRKKKAEAVA